MAVLTEFDVITPQTLDAALDVLTSTANVRPLAGGTDLMVQLESRSLPPCTFLNIENIRELQPPAEWAGPGVILPAMTTYRDVRCSPLRYRFPMLATAAREVGAIAIQSRGTWAGNIANASPAADGVPAMMAYDAEVELASKAGRRRVPVAKFYRGYKQNESRLCLPVHV